MSLPVFLVPSLDGVGVGEVVTVTGDEAHHAVAVRRLSVGESVVLTDGRGGLATGPILATGKRVMRVQTDEFSRVAEPTPAIWVVQALPKRDRGERAVEVLTEIGVARIIPWASERAVGQWRGERADRSLARWRATARESGKQSRRSWAVEVAPLIQTTDLLALVAEADLAIVLHEEATGPLADVPIPAAGTIILVVGPEGGLTQGEVESLALAGGVSVRLGAEILRTSTAGAVACAAVLSRTPRWGAT